MSKNGLSIGTKLATIIGILVLLSLASVTFVVNYFIRSSEGVTAEANNLTMNIRAHAAVEKELNTICSNSFGFLDNLAAIAETDNKKLLLQVQNSFFQRNKNVICILLADKSSLNLSMINKTFFETNKISESKTTDFVNAHSSKLTQVCNGNSFVISTKNDFIDNSAAIMVPWGKSPSLACVIVLSTESISEVILSGARSINSTFVVNGDGEYLAGAEPSEVLLAKVKDSTEKSSQISFTDKNEKSYFGAFKKSSLFDICVLTTAEKDLVYEAINQTTINNIYLTLVILGFTVLIVLVYTHFFISKPLKILAGAVKGISGGQFENDYLELLDLNRSDEIGVLNSGVNDERDFLNTFSRFTNQNVATAIATKSIDFEPHPKDISIFFSDIRGFTAISNDFKNRFGADSASQIIGFLNDYMSRMVECVTLSHGNIDKFEGDAIMAVWGLLRDDDLSFENMPDGPQKIEKQSKHLQNVQEDAVNCITGSIAMRYALLEYNKKAAMGKNKPHIAIGCGINTGRASVGLLGSKDKMEYTSIGDAVNFASRTESSNKPCGTDILITEDTFNLLKTNYIKCEENNFTIPAGYEEKEILVEKIPVGFEVKGKGEQHFYAVVNMPNFDIEQFFRQAHKDFMVDTDCSKACGKKGPKSLNEVRTLLGIPVPDYAKVNLNGEESKIQIKN